MPRKSSIATLQADLDRLQDRALYADKTKLPALIARTLALQVQLERRFRQRAQRKQSYDTPLGSLHRSSPLAS